MTLYRFWRWITEVRHDSIDLVLVTSAAVALTFGFCPFVMVLAADLIVMFVLAGVRSKIEGEDER